MAKKLGTLIDQLNVIILKQKTLDKTAAELKAKRIAKQEEVVKALKAANVTSSKGKSMSVSLTESVVPQVKDWNKFYPYMTKTKGFDMLQRRVNGKAIMDRINDGKKVPGIETFTVEKFNYKIS